jgi:hypothetical protein
MRRPWGAILVPLSAPDACLRLWRCAPSPPSGGLQELRVHGIADGELASDPEPWSTSPSQREIWTRQELPQAAQTRNGRRFGAARDMRTSPSKSHRWVDHGPPDPVWPHVIAHGAELSQAVWQPKGRARTIPGIHRRAQAVPWHT